MEREKRRPGRPSLKVKRQTIGMTVLPETYRKLHDQAERLQRSIGWVVDELVKKI